MRSQELSLGTSWSFRGDSGGSRGIRGVPEGCSEVSGGLKRSLYLSFRYPQRISVTFVKSLGVIGYFLRRCKGKSLRVPGRFQGVSKAL